jgi:hypothetical protein
MEFDKSPHGIVGERYERPALTIELRPPNVAKAHVRWVLVVKSCRAARVVADAGITGATGAVRSRSAPPPATRRRSLI